MTVLVSLCCVYGCPPGDQFFSISAKRARECHLKVYMKTKVNRGVDLDTNLSCVITCHLWPFFASNPAESLRSMLTPPTVTSCHLWGVVCVGFTPGWYPLDTGGVKPPQVRQFAANGR